MKIGYNLILSLSLSLSLYVHINLLWLQNKFKNFSMISFWVEKCLHIFSFRNKLLGHTMLLAILFGTGHDISCIWVIIVVVILQQTYRDHPTKWSWKISKFSGKMAVNNFHLDPFFALVLKPGFWLPEMWLTFEEAPSMYWCDAAMCVWTQLRYDFTSCECP